MNKSADSRLDYYKDSLTLVGAVALGTGVIFGAGIFALTGQMAQMAGSLFPLAFLSAAVVVLFSAYSYVKMSNAYPSGGGIAMYLKKAYGNTVTTAFHALLMYFSMVIAQSFLARTFGTYALQLVNIEDKSWLVPALGVGLLLVAFLINLATNNMIEGVASILGFIKIGGIVLFGVVGVWVADKVEVNFTTVTPDASITGFFGATALGILAFKGFTSITNSRSELKDPHRNVGRAIMISIALCMVIYALVGLLWPVTYHCKKSHRHLELLPSRGSKAGFRAVCSLVYGGVGNGRRCHSQHICGFSNAGYADRNETSSP